MNFKPSYFVDFWFVVSGKQEVFSVRHTLYKMINLRHQNSYNSPSVK